MVRNFEGPSFFLLPFEDSGRAKMLLFQTLRMLDIIEMVLLPNLMQELSLRGRMLWCFLWWYGRLSSMLCRKKFKPLLIMLAIKRMVWARKWFIDWRRSSSLSLFFASWEDGSWRFKWLVVTIFPCCCQGGWIIVSIWQYYGYASLFWAYTLIETWLEI